MDSRVILRAGIGFYAGTFLWTLPESLYRIHGSYSVLLLSHPETCIGGPKEHINMMILLSGSNGN